MDYSNNQKLISQDNKNISLIWFSFYNYFCLPLFLLATIVSIVFSLIILLVITGLEYMNFGDAFTNKMILDAVFRIIVGIIIILTTIGLYFRRTWAYKLNFVVLLVTPFTVVFINYFTLMPSDTSRWFIIICIIVSQLIWTILNWRYFSKRKFVFINN